MVRVTSWVDLKNKGQVTGQLFLLQTKKIGFGLGIFRVELENFDLFCHV